jgi:hypothetical protein
MSHNRDVTAASLCGRPVLAIFAPMSAILALLLTCAGLSACVELKVDPVAAALQADTLPKSDSLTYNLSETTITVTGTITLNDCDEITGDVSGAIAVPIVQLGRVYVQPLRNVLFQTSTAALTVAADGSIANVGTQSSSAAAAGFTAATGAANAQASATAARNTAVAGQNTAASAQTTAAAATFADTVNKALADCLTQQAAIVKADGRPVACQ